MKALDWQKYLDAQRREHGKVLFTVAELSNVAGTSIHNVNEELRRLVERGVLTRYAKGMYGLPRGVTVEALVGELDRRAYITSAYALHLHSIITQSVFEIECFTRTRHGNASVRNTPLGRLRFVCVKPGVYCPPEVPRIAGPEQALWDLVYVSRRSGVQTQGQFTFRNLDKLDGGILAALASRYPKAAARDVREIVERHTTHI